MQQRAGATEGLESELKEARQRSDQLMEELRAAEKGSDHMQNVISSMRKDMALHQVGARARALQH